MTSSDVYIGRDRKFEVNKSIVYKRIFFFLLVTYVLFYSSKKNEINRILQQCDIFTRSFNELISMH